MKPRDWFSILLIGLLLLAVIPSGEAAARPDQNALAAVMAAYQRLRTDHLQASDSAMLFRAAALGMQRAIAGRMPPPSSRLRWPEVPDLTQPLASLVLRGNEQSDAQSFREHFLWTSYLTTRYISPGALGHAAIRGMTEAFDDPYTLFLTPREYLRLQGRERGGPYVGIGVSVVFEREGPVILGVTEDGPAARAGLRPGDVILRIDGQPVASLAGDEVIDALRGTPDTRVTVEVRRPGAATPISRSIVRGVIHEPPTKAVIVEPGIGLLRVQTFSDAAAQAALKHLADLQSRGARGLILDLQGNPGGSVLAALLLASAFLDHGTVAVATGRSGKTVAYPVLPVRVKFTGPVAVLVDELTASSAEIVAGALQDAGAILVGRRTYGKAIIQSIYPLPDGSAVKLTTARYVTPRGRDIGQKGLAPDLLVPRERSDDALRRAIEWLRGRVQGMRPRAA